MSLRSTTRVAVSAAPGGALRYDDLRSHPPLALRPTREALHLVGTAASPVATDDVRLELAVGPAATLHVRSVAATVAWRGRGSRSEVRAEVGCGATLHWRPEPLVATAGCHHVTDARVDLHPGASLRWEERLVLGRHREGPGRLRSRLRIDVAGRPLLRHELHVGADAPAWDGPAVCGAHRAVGLIVLAGDAAAGARAGAADIGGASWAVASLDGPGVMVVACAPGAVELDVALSAALASERGPVRTAGGAGRSLPSRG
ncbi:MAG TPA: urease accessory protein UreD [Acidimicrobiales bacterium]|nr:urease accessory protein UreD [Acidimicrobiales bacterium]